MAKKERMRDNDNRPTDENKREKENEKNHKKTRQTPSMNADLIYDYIHIVAGAAVVVAMCALAYWKRPSRRQCSRACCVAYLYCCAQRAGRPPQRAMPLDMGAALVMPKSI
jgi:hypothetical protein